LGRAGSSAFVAGLLVLIAVGVLPAGLTRASPFEDLLLDLMSPHEHIRARAAEKLSKADVDDLKQVVSDLARGLSDNSWRVRCACSEALKRCGPAAALVVPALLRSLNREEDNVAVVENVHATLVRIGQPSVGPLVKNLRKAEGWSSRIRIRTIAVLEDLGPLAKDAMQQMIRVAARDDFPQVQRAAAYAIVRIDPENRRARQVILRPLVAGLAKDEPVGVRFRCAVTLSYLGSQGKSAIPVLLEFLRADPLRWPDSWREEFPHSDIRPAAAEALLRLGPVVKSVNPVLEELLRDPKLIGNPHLRTLLGTIILRMEPNNPTAVGALEKLIPGLVDDLRDHVDNIDAVIAAEALGRLGPRARRALPALRKAAQSATKDLRERAQWAIREID
jgi:HEAT repeat protein